MNYVNNIVTSRFGAHWIMLPDSISLENCKIYENEIEESCKGTIDKVVLDFSRVNNIYSSGLGLIIRLKKFVQQKNGELCIVNVSEKLSAFFKSLNLDKVFTIFSTDTEYEISQKDIWENAKNAVKAGFIFASQVENNLCRIIISGDMVYTQELSCCAKFQPQPNVNLYIFDLSSLGQVDSTGAYQFLNLTSRIAQTNSKCRAFGVQEFIRETLNLLSATRFITFFKNEKDALQGVNPLKL